MTERYSSRKRSNRFIRIDQTRNESFITSTVFYTNIVLPFIGTAATFLPYIFNLFDDHNELSQFNVTIITMAAFQLVLVFIVWASSWQVRSATKSELDAHEILAGYRYSDKIFREVADVRNKFDKDAFAAAEQDFHNRKRLGDADINAEDIDELDRVVMDYFDYICEATEKVLITRRRLPDKAIAVHIKMFKDVGDFKCYHLESYSQGYVRDRVSIHETRDWRDYKVSDNFIFDDIITNHKDRFFMNNDMASVIDQKNHIRYPEPNMDALRYYKKCIVVPIAEYIPRKERIRKKGKTPENIESDYSGRVIGMIVADTAIEDPYSDFDQLLDLSIMREMAINVYSACKLKNLLLEYYSKR